MADVDGVAESLRETVRSKRLRRLAAAVVVAVNRGGFEVVGDRVATLYEAWNDRHSEAADRNLTEAGYKSEWNVARILALHGSAEATERFLRLAGELRGRRRKPLTDRRHLIAIASLADHRPQELVDLMSHRFEAVRGGRFRPDHKTRLTLAALMTLGAVAPESRLRPAFHGFVIRDHYVSSYAEATSG